MGHGIVLACWLGLRINWQGEIEGAWGQAKPPFGGLVPVVSALWGFSLLCLFDWVYWGRHCAGYFALSSMVWFSFIEA